MTVEHIVALNHDACRRPERDVSEAPLSRGLHVNRTVDQLHLLPECR
jgi:hypothetical protein